MGVTQRQSFEPRRMILAIVLLHTAITGFSSSAAGLNGKGLEASECSEEDCATLYLLTSTGEEIPIKKTISKMKQKDVAGARGVGSGCFTIFKGKGFSGSSVTVAPSAKLMLAEQGHHWTTVKSVKTRRCAREKQELTLATLAWLVSLLWFFWRALSMEDSSTGDEGGNMKTFQKRKR